MSTSAPSLGISPPLSLSGPTEEETQESNALQKLIIELEPPCAEAELRLREQVLAKLNDIVKQWIVKISVQKGLSEAMAEEAGGHILTFGSYRLGVDNPGSDIDTLCVAPRYVDHTHFFGELRVLLESCPECTELSPVPDARVPIMKFYFMGVSIDLLFASLAKYTQIPDNLDITDDSILSNLEEQSMLSVNGCRVADHIIKLVPNLETFRGALRFIKLWARRRGVYCNAIGFLGGIAWALMTARICQLYPNALPSRIISRFFKMYKQWDWQRHPVTLNRVNTEGPLGFKVWNPVVNRRDRLHVMPVITPAYPASNSTYNVSKSTFSVMHEEFERGDFILNSEENMKRPVYDVYKELVEEVDFFSCYRKYLRIDIIASNEEDHRLWHGWIESRLRILVAKLEEVEMVTRAHPYPVCFTISPKPSQKVNISEFTNTPAEGELGSDSEDEKSQSEPIVSQDGDGSVDPRMEYDVDDKRNATPTKLCDANSNKHVVRDSDTETESEQEDNRTAVGGGGDESTSERQGNEGRFTGVKQDVLGENQEEKEESYDEEKEESFDAEAESVEYRSCYFFGILLEKSEKTTVVRRRRSRQIYISNAVSFFKAHVLKDFRFRKPSMNISISVVDIVKQPDYVFPTGQVARDCKKKRKATASIRDKVKRQKTQHNVPTVSTTFADASNVDASAEMELSSTFSPIQEQPQPTVSLTNSFVSSSQPNRNGAGLKLSLSKKSSNFQPGINLSLSQKPSPSLSFSLSQR